MYLITSHLTENTCELNSYKQPYNPYLDLINSYLTINNNGQGGIKLNEF